MMLVYMSRLDCVAFNSIHVVASVSMQFEATRFVPRLVFEEVGPVHKTTLYFKLLLTRVVRFLAPHNLNILTLERRLCSTLLLSCMNHNISLDRSGIATPDC